LRHRLRKWCGRFRQRCWGNGERRAATHRSKCVEHFAEGRLAQRLDRTDDGDFEVHLLIRRPFYSPFGGGELIDQFEQTIDGNQFRVCGQRFLNVRINVFV